MSYLVNCYKLKNFGESSFLVTDKGLIKINQNIAFAITKVLKFKTILKSEIKKIAVEANINPDLFFNYIFEKIELIKVLQNKAINSILVLTENQSFFKIIKNEIEKQTGFTVRTSIESNFEINDNELCINLDFNFNKNKLKIIRNKISKSQNTFLLHALINFNQLILSNLYSSNLGSPCPLCFLENQNEFTARKSNNKNNGFLSVINSLKNLNITPLSLDFSESDLIIILRYISNTINLFTSQIEYNFQKTIYQLNIIDLNELTNECETSIHWEGCDCLDNYYVNHLAELKYEL